MLINQGLYVLALKYKRIIGTIDFPEKFLFIRFRYLYKCAYFIASSSNCENGLSEMAKLFKAFQIIGSSTHVANLKHIILRNIETLKAKQLLDAKFNFDEFLLRN